MHRMEQIAFHQYLKKGQLLRGLQIPLNLVINSWVGIQALRAAPCMALIHRSILMWRYTRIGDHRPHMWRKWQNQQGLGTTHGARRCITLSIERLPLHGPDLRWRFGPIVRADQNCTFAIVVGHGRPSQVQKLCMSRVALQKRCILSVSRKREISTRISWLSKESNETSLSYAVVVPVCNN